MTPDPGAEWLETDGLGGFASGTVSGLRTRRYHGLLIAARRPPTERMALVQGFDAWVETAAGRFPVTSQRYASGTVSPLGGRRIEEFHAHPWPRWTYVLDDGTRIEHELFMPKGHPATVVTWRALDPAPGTRLVVRPFLSGRDYHALHHENGDFWFDPETDGDRLLWRPYAGVPGVFVLTNGAYAHEPYWYRGFLYEEERRRGLDFTEDLASPGTLSFDLHAEEAAMVVAAHAATEPPLFPGRRAHAVVAELRASEGVRRAAFRSQLHRAADAYIVQRGPGHTIVAGYPWFTDWGRDTFIALRGLCLATGRLDEARGILLGWAGAVSEGMLPNRFPDQGDAPEFNSVDASLWYVIAVHDYIHAARAAHRTVPADEKRTLLSAVDRLLEGYAAGTRHGIRMDEDGLLAAGEPGVQLTWMDARVGDREITPRIGKPVEIQALWLNALAIASDHAPVWKDVLARGVDAFRERFWNENDGCLHDVVDCDHVAGATDAAFRPNQILAVGGLPLALLDADRARQVVDAVEARLLTPLGLRTLAPADPDYVPRCEGGVAERDAAYHQGTVWPWLLGPFVEAWVRVRGGGPEARGEARRRFLEPVLAHLDQAGLGHVSEILDGEAPHTPRGCPFQAWSLGELLRLDHVVLAEESRTPARARPASRASNGLVASSEA